MVQPVSSTTQQQAETSKGDVVSQEKKPASVFNGAISQDTGATCNPKDPILDTIGRTLKAVTFDLTPGNLVENGDLGITELDVGDLSEFNIQCENIKEILMDTLEAICKFRDEPLCGNNELTRSLRKLCELYPSYYQKCCFK